jgi:hypothetical protein
MFLCLFSLIGWVVSWFLPGNVLFEIWFELVLRHFRKNGEKRMFASSSLCHVNENVGFAAAFAAAFDVAFSWEKFKAWSEANSVTTLSEPIDISYFPWCELLDDMAFKLASQLQRPEQDACSRSDWKRIVMLQSVKMVESVESIEKLKSWKVRKSKNRAVSVISRFRKSSLNQARNCRGLTRKCL